MNEHIHHTATGTGDFPSDVVDLPEVVDSPVLELDDGDEVELRIAPAAKQIGDAKVRMLAYNGSVPGPTLRVHEGAELVVNVANEGDLDATVHWHGLRLDNRYDGTHETQAPIPVGRGPVLGVRGIDEQVAVEAELEAVVLPCVGVVPVQAGVGELDSVREGPADGDRGLCLVRAVVSVVEP